MPNNAFNSTFTDSGLNSIYTFGSFMEFPYLLFFGVVIIAGSLLILSGYERYARLRLLFGFLGRTTMYFVKGAVGLAAVTLSGLGVSLVFEGHRVGAFNIWLTLMWIGMVVSGFFGLAVLGFILDKAWTWARRNHGRWKKERKAATGRS